MPVAFRGRCLEMHHGRADAPRCVAGIAAAVPPTVSSDSIDERRWQEVRTLRSAIATAELAFEETQALATRCQRHDIISYAAPSGEDAMLSVSGRTLTVRLLERSFVEVRRSSGRTVRLRADASGASLVDDESGRPVELTPYLRKQISALFR